MAGETARELLQGINTGTGSKFSYRKLSKRVDNILAMSGEERKNAMADLYKELVTESSTACLTRRAVYSLNEKLYTKYFLQTHQNINGTAGMVDKMLATMCQEKDTDFKVEDRFGVDIDEQTQLLLDIANGFTVARVRDEFFKVADYQMLRDDLKLASEKSTRPYKANFNDSFDRGIAEIYYGHTLKKEELESHGLFWKIFHPIQNARLNAYVRDTKAFLDKVGFNISEHGEDAINNLFNNVDRITEQDFARIKGHQKSVKEAEKEAKNPNPQAPVEKISVAEDKYREAENKEIKDPKTKQGIGGPLHDALNPILKKYGIPYPEIRGGVPCGFTMGGELTIARNYDRTRDVSLYKSYMNYNFRKNFMNLFSEAVKSGKQISVGEIVKDACDIYTTIAKNHTLLYDLKETENIAKETVFGGYTVDMTMDLAKKILKDEGKLENYDLDAMEKDIENAMSTYKCPFLRPEEPKLEEVNENQLENIQEVDEKKEIDSNELKKEDTESLRERIEVSDANEKIEDVKPEIKTNEINPPSKSANIV